MRANIVLASNTSLLLLMHFDKCRDDASTPPLMIADCSERGFFLLCYYEALVGVEFPPLLMH